MQFRWHFLFGFIVSYILVFFFNFSLLSGFIIFLASWIIDLDHYLWYAIKTKDWNPLHAIRWYLRLISKWGNLSFKEKRKFKQGVFVLHSLLFWLILAVLSFSHVFFLWVLIGIMIHMVADLIDLYVRRKPLYGKIFLCYVIKRNKNRKESIKL